MPSFDDAEFDLGGAFKPPTLTDNSPFPFGQHKGKKMSDVPADYLIWCSEQEWLESRYASVANYIDKSWKAIEQELRDRPQRTKYYDDDPGWAPGSNNGDLGYCLIDEEDVPF